MCLVHMIINLYSSRIDKILFLGARTNSHQGIFINHMELYGCVWTCVFLYGLSGSVLCDFESELLHFIWSDLGPIWAQDPGPWSDRRIRWTRLSP